MEREPPLEQLYDWQPPTIQEADTVLFSEKKIDLSTFFRIHPPRTVRKIVLSHCSSDDWKECLSILKQVISINRVEWVTVQNCNGLTRDLLREIRPFDQIKYLELSGIEAGEPKIGNSYGILSANTEYLKLGNLHTYSEPSLSKQLDTAGMYRGKLKRLEPLVDSTSLQQVSSEDQFIRYANCFRYASLHLTISVKPRSLRLFFNNSPGLKSLIFGPLLCNDLHLTEGLIELPNLTYLVLRGTSITHAGVKAIAGKLQQLQHLNLDGNPIGSEGAYHIGRSLTRLLKLRVIACRITHEGVPFLSYLPNLNSLSFTANHWQGPQGISAVTRNLSKVEMCIDGSPLAVQSRQLSMLARCYPAWNRPIIGYLY